MAAEHRWTPGERLPEGRWAPRTRVRTSTGEHAQVLSYATERPNQCRCDAVFVQPLHLSEQSW